MYHEARASTKCITGLSARRAAAWRSDCTPDQINFNSWKNFDACLYKGMINPI